MSSTFIQTLRTKFWYAIYNAIAVPLMYVFFRLAAILPSKSRGVQKIRSGVSGRKNLFVELERRLEKIPASNPRVWIHASSMGECEQAKPILRELRAAFPNVTRILTIFSPSAYASMLRQKDQAEVTCYLPFDSPSQSKRFVDLVRPSAGVVIRHDTWPNILRLCNQRNIFLCLANASVSVNANTLRHKPIVREFNREIFSHFDVITAVSENAALDLDDVIRYRDRLLILGDTRYDQVSYRTRNARLQDILPPAWASSTCFLVAGSTWPSDEEVIVPAFAKVRERFPDARMILVPHEPIPHHLELAETKLAQCGLSSVRLSKEVGANETDVLLVDRVGVLAELYGAGHVAFVGGSFGPGVHSVLEAAAHGKPVLVGPRMYNSAEAIAMQELGFARIVHTIEESGQLLLQLADDPKKAQEWGEQCREFVEARAGAAKKIVELLAPAIRRN